MKKLIDKHELMVKIHQNPASNHAMRCVQLLDAITCAPIVDAVPIVRCKDCKHRCMLECPMFYEAFVDDNETFGYWDDRDNTEDDGFCYLGEKIEEEKDE